MVQLLSVPKPLLHVPTSRIVHLRPLIMLFIISTLNRRPLLAATSTIYVDQF